MNLYDGRYLAAHGVVVVTFNYRLGAMGFTGTKEGVGGGTGHLNGVHDQIVALQWVQAYIASFGGDPKQVTVFGESAGSISTCILTVSPLAAGLFSRAIMSSGICTAGMGQIRGRIEGDQSDLPSNAELRKLTPEEVFARQDLFWGDPTGTRIDGWVLPEPALDIIDKGGLNVDSVLVGGNSFDSLMAFLLHPGSGATLHEAQLYTLANMGYSLSAALEVMDHYQPERFLQTSAAFLQLDADLGYVCPAKWLQQKFAALGKTARFFLFEYGPSCSDGALPMLKAENSPYVTAGGWASHAADLSYVFNTTSGADNACNPWTEETFEPAGSSRRLVTAMQQLWTSFAKTGVPSADPELFTVPTPAGAAQWPPAAAGATVGAADNSPVLVLGSKTLGIVAGGTRDDECALLYAQKYGDNFPAWQLALSLAISGLTIAAAVVAVHLEKLPSPGQAPAGGPVKCERAARLCSGAAVPLSLPLAALPFLAPHGVYPLVLAVWCGCVLLLREPRLMLATSAVVVLLTWWQLQQLVMFAAMAMTHDARSGSRDFVSTAAAVLSSVVGCTFLFLPCLLCCTSRHLQHGADASAALEPLAPIALEELGGGRTEGSGPKG